MIVDSTVYSDADQRKHQSSALLAFVRGIHRGPVNSPHQWPVTRKMFPFDDVIMETVALDIGYVLAWNWYLPCFVFSIGNRDQIRPLPSWKNSLIPRKLCPISMKKHSRVNFTSKLNTDINSNPDTSYNIFINTILDVKNKQFPKTFVKLRKHKHEMNKWITYGIIRSIKIRDAMHLTLKRKLSHATEYATLKHNICVFDKI